MKEHVMRKMIGIWGVVLGAMMAAGQTTAPATGPATKPAQVQDLMAFIKSLPPNLQPSVDETRGKIETRDEWYADHSKGKQFRVAMKIGGESGGKLFAIVEGITIRASLADGERKVSMEDTISIVGSITSCMVRLEYPDGTHRKTSCIVEMSDCRITRYTKRSY